MVINDTTFQTDLWTILTELQAQLAANGVQLLQVMKDTPDNVMVACPYHKGGQERRPSMGISKSTGVCHCFACETVVSLPQMISHCFGDESQIGAFGWNWLLKNFLTISVEERKDVELDFARSENSVSKCSASGTVDSSGDGAGGYITEEELDRYRYIHPYMYKRKLTDEVIELFDIGYDKNTNCITFPIRDIHGNTLFIARRSVKTKYFNYPSGAEKPLYGLYELNYTAKQLGDQIQEVIICESMLDALAFWGAEKYAVALNGLGTDLQFKQLRELFCRKLILCTDMDEAGQAARQRIKKNVPNKLVTEYFLPMGRKDANDCTFEELQALQDVF